MLERKPEQEHGMQMDSWGDLELGTPKQRLRKVFSEITFES